MIGGAELVFTLPLVTFALAAAGIAAAGLTPRARNLAAATFAAAFTAGTLYAPLSVILWMIPVLLAATMLAGGLTAAAPSIPAPAAALLAVVIGWTCGLSTAPDHGSTSAVAASIGGSLGGAVLGVSALAWLLRGGTRLAGPRIGPVALRVLGAWVAAIAAMMLALHFAPLVR